MVRRFFPRRYLAYEVIFVLLLVSARSLCHPSEGESRFRVVLIVSKQTIDLSHDVIDAVSSQLSDMDIQIQEEWVESLPKEMTGQFALAREISEASHVDLVVWHEQTAQGDVLLFISDSKSERMLARRLSATDEGGQSEALALIVRSAVETVLFGGDMGRPTDSPMESEGMSLSPTAATVTVQSDGFRVIRNCKGAFAIMAGGGFHLRSAEHPVIAGGQFQFIWRPIPQLMVGLGYGVWQPINVKQPSVSLQIHKHPVSLSAGYIKRIRSIDFKMELGITVDIETQTTNDVGIQGADAYDNANVLLFLLPTIGMDINFHRYAFVFLNYGVALGIRQAKYVYRGSESETVVEQPWRWQPQFALGVGFRIF